MNSFFPYITYLRKNLPAEYFSLTYDLKSFQSRVYTHLLFSTIFHIIFALNFPSFTSSFSPNSKLAMAIQSCVEWIPINKYCVSHFEVFTLLWKYVYNHYQGKYGFKKEPQWLWHIYTTLLCLLTKQFFLLSHD